MYMTSYPPALSSQLSLDEMLYDPSQPNKVYTFDEAKKMATENGHYNLPDSEIQKAVDIMNSQNPQQALADTTLQTPVTQFSASTTPALDPTPVTANPVTPPAVLEQVPTNMATAARKGARSAWPPSPSFTAFYNSQRHPDAAKYTDPSLYGKATGNYVPKHLLMNVMFDEKGDIKEQWRDSYFEHKEHYSPAKSQPMLTTGDPSVTAPVSQPMLNPETTTMGVSSPTVDTAQNEQRLQEMFDGMNVAKEGKTGHTGLARESTSTFHKLAMTGMGEKLMRMGAAMNANAHLGGNAMLGAMGQQQAAYNADRLAAQQFEQEQRANALSAYNTAIAEQQDSLNIVDDTLRGYENALADFDRFSSVTGLVDGTFTQMLDNAGLGNDARQAFRLRLKQITVDTTLLNTAKTKGAISDREMALFQSPVPSMYATEGVWREWLQSRIEATKIIRRRIAQGITVARDADSTLNLYDYTADTDAQNAAQKAQITAQGNQNMSPAPQAQQTVQITSEFSDDELADIEANL